MSKDRCKQWRKHFEASNTALRTFQGEVNLDQRHAEFILLNEDYREPFVRFEREVLESILGLGVDKEVRDKIAMYRYPIGVGFEVHHDVVTEKERLLAQERGNPIVGGDITVILMLSDPDEYEGGELVFPNHGVTMKLPMGSIIAYPASYFYLHGVNPITSGERFSVVCRSNLRP